MVCPYSKIYAGILSVVVGGGGVVMQMWHQGFCNMLKLLGFDGKNYGPLYL